MKSFSLICALVLSASPLLRAENLSQADINKAVAYLEKTRAEVIKATKGLSPAQWNYKPATNRWSVAEVTEHIAAAEDFIRANIEEKVMKAPAGTNAANAKSVDALVMQRVP